MIKIAQSIHNKYVEQNYYNDPVLQGVFELQARIKRLFIYFLSDGKKVNTSTVWTHWELNPTPLANFIINAKRA